MWSICIEIPLLSTIVIWGWSPSPWRWEVAKACGWRTAWIDVRASSGSWGGGRKFAAGKDDGDVDHCAVDLGFVHVGDGSLSVSLGGIEDVGGAAIRCDCDVSSEHEDEDEDEDDTNIVCSLACLDL